MFQKNKLTDPVSKPAAEAEKPPAEPRSPVAAPGPAAAPKAPASVLSSDLTVIGNVRTQGDITVQGKVEGDIRAQLLTVGEGAVVSGEIVADDVVVNGRVIGRVRGLKVRLTSTARVEGDIIHKTIAIEAGAHFEGSVQRNENPLAEAKEALPPPASRQAAEGPAPGQG
ncbi:bactofilin family protein [Mangrovicoccus algicola]|uniref:Polymer-forming cytoskeletal protein n=1 Tax=Mangrovicoccus algicola TaxID=2771008 RepID=A0A8J6YQI5_9RHOB|nr:polymer-forming cytoskeletal protein [Mangrovicoccus algicola]MBE3637698.1 polymer-forming cytoskeletal protein [Mangrovicoccus algicola]